MGYRNLQETVAALEKTGQLKRIDVEVDPYLEVGVIQRRVYAAGGPALLFSRRGIDIVFTTMIIGLLAGFALDVIPPSRAATQDISPEMHCFSASQ